MEQPSKLVLKSHNNLSSSSIPQVSIIKQNCKGFENAEINSKRR